MMMKYLRMVPVVFLLHEVCNGKVRMQQHIILDAGSSGTRFYLFAHNLHDDSASSTIINSTVIGQVKPGLSNLDGDGRIFTQIEALFDQAAESIPEEHRANVPVWFLGTAGMRSTVEAQQARIWELVHQRQGFKLFHPNLKAHTISGRTEGLYSLTCANHLAALDRTMRHGRPFGILDLGGSSTQIAKPPVDGDELYIQSFSDAGMDVVYTKLGQLAETCHFKGYVAGSVGNATACREVIQKIVGPTLEAQIRNASVATSPNLKFLAVSGYVYVVDFVHSHTGIDKFPRPSLKELEKKVNVLCATEWDTVAKDSREKPHAYTHSVEKASLRCYEANYVITLLRWYGFTNDERRVTFLDKIAGNSLEWPLGALVNHYENHRLWDANLCGRGDCHRKPSAVEWVE